MNVFITNYSNCFTVLQKKIFFYVCAAFISALKIFTSIIFKLIKLGAPTNFVPAVAVIRKGQVFFVLTGRKARVEG